VDDTTEFAVCSNATIQDKHAPEWCCWAAAREYLRSVRSRAEHIWQTAIRFMCRADNLSTGSLANLEQRARSNSPPSIISSQFENATPELNKLRALTGFTP
jgi:hypothetical protein